MTSEVRERPRAATSSKTRSFYLGGFVGVGRDHPLSGWDKYALRAAGLRVHGGISYTAECRDWESPARDICHVHPIRERSRDTVARRTLERSRDTTAARAHEVVLNERSHEDLWWIGFECDKQENLVLGEGAGRPRNPGYEGAIDPVYRDEGCRFLRTASVGARPTRRSLMRSCTSLSATRRSPPPL